MPTFTKRIDSGVRDLSDISQSGFTVASTTDVIGRVSDNPNPDKLYNLSLRFTGITIPVGATINSAIITFTSPSGDTNTLVYKITGVAEDNTAEFTTSPIDDARTRSHTSATINWNQAITTTVNSTYDTPDITSIIQEIINRGGWASGNAIGIYLYDNGTSANNDKQFYDYGDTPSKAALLTVVYTPVGSSPSASISPSSSMSPSASISPSSSISPSISPSSSISSSLSPSAAPNHVGGVLKVAKPGINVLTNSDPDKFIFSSEYGTLKYLSKQAVNISFDASTGDISAKGSYAHNLGYYPYAEVYVSVNGGAYEYCPFSGSGASVQYAANVIIDTSKITVYGEISGVSSSIWTFNFLIFVFKNDLHL